ncbi:MAG: HAMP domain-containing histidine kinase [Clostridia bacterium]|nr:HAMP domain-containing histidine kinase [Clostridia bacterium]
MKKEGRYHSILKAVNHYIVIFLLVAFVITCCTMLFVSVLSDSLGFEFTEQNINRAAKLTLINVVGLSLIFTLLDLLRRRFTVARPIKKITDAADKIMQGDFSVRIEPMKGRMGDDSFNPIIDCFNKMAEELSGTETLRTDFIANVSHELKTPLAVMQNYATMLQNPHITDEQREEYAKSISAASRRLADLISNILKLNKLENQQIAPQKQLFDLGEQLCECFLAFEEIWDRKNISIETDIAENIVVASDRDMLSLVWNNLFSNAFKFTPEGGQVTLQLEAEGDHAIVRVIDSGCGISRDVGARIFDKFYQGDTSHATQGNGLGLALVKRVVDLTECDISVESQVGKGSTFTVKMRRETVGEAEKTPE